MGAGFPYSVITVQCNYSVITVRLDSNYTVGIFLKTCLFRQTQSKPGVRLHCGPVDGPVRPGYIARTDCNLPVVTVM